jgi:hypothetical protein
VNRVAHRVFPPTVLAMRTSPSSPLPVPSLIQTTVSPSTGAAGSALRSRSRIRSWKSVADIDLIGSGGAVGSGPAALRQLGCRLTYDVADRLAGLFDFIIGKRRVDQEGETRFTEFACHR